MITDISFIIRYPDFDSFLARFGDFVNTKSNDLVRYYSGELVNIKSTIEELDYLISEYDHIIGKIDLAKHRLSDNVEMWDILDLIDDIGVRLQTFKNLPKWLRSNFYLEYSNKQNVSGFIKSNQTIESLANELGIEDSDQEWADIAITNDLPEEDYTYKGEKTVNVKVNFSQINQTFNSVDIMQGDNILGKDISRSIIFTDEDVEYLTTKDTLVQSASIILEVMKGSIAEFMELGVNKEQVSSNIASLQFPSLMRQLSETFSQDDSFESIELIGISEEQSEPYMQLKITSKVGSELDKQYRIFDDTFDNTYN